MSRKLVKIDDDLVNVPVKTFLGMDIIIIYIGNLSSWLEIKPAKEDSISDDPLLGVSVGTQVYLSLQPVYRIEDSVWFVVNVDYETRIKAV